MGHVHPQDIQWMSEIRTSLDFRHFIYIPFPDSLDFGQSLNKFSIFSLQSHIDIAVDDSQKGVKVLRQAEVQLENSYEVKLYLDGGIICQMQKNWNIRWTCL